jgi:hypothetical protein
MLRTMKITIAALAAIAGVALTAAPAAAATLAASGSPEPVTWAAMVAGFAIGGGMIHRRGRRYRLVEALEDGQERSEEFVAPDDATALRRAALAAGGAVAVYRGERQISA